MNHLLLSILLLVCLHSIAQDNSVANVKIKCTDSVGNALTQLQEKDSLIIKDHILGCFVNRIEKLVIVKKGGKLIASTFTLERELTRGKKLVWVERKKLQKTAILTSENIQDFIKFEVELSYLNEGDNCTTSESYEVSSKYWNLKKVDGSCNWHGLYNLRKKIFKED